VAPTRAGEELLAGLTQAFAEIAEAVERVNSFRATPSGSLRINAPKPVAQLLLAPMAAGFLAAHPGVALEISADDGFVDIVAEGFDAGIRFGESLHQDMVAVAIGPPQRMIVFGSPAYLNAHGRPERPSDLVGHVLIRHRFPGGSIFPWELERDGQTVAITPTGPLTTGDPAIKLRAAIDGVGLAFEFEGYALAALAEGRLERVLDAWCPAIPAPYLYYPSRRHVPAALRAFIDFARAALKPE
jgi:DNA-binding transcriptional LysR family regulator